MNRLAINRLMGRVASLAVAGAFLLGASAAVQAADKAAGKQGVVIQVSDKDPAKWNLALSNAKNVQADLGKDNVDIEIVAYGPGIGMLKVDTEAAGALEQAQKAGVKLTACQNTMRNQKLTEKDMHPAAGYVPAGVVQIMKRQQEGWAYVRP